MVLVSRTFEQVVAQALQGAGTDVTLADLIALCGLDLGDELGSALAVRERIQPFGLDLLPGFNEGGLKTGRVLRVSGALAPIDVPALLGQYDESSTLELKSSLLCDIKRHEATGQRHRSDSVAHEILKTICGFANADGGILLVGVDDEKRICGLEADYALGINGADRWQLELSSLIAGRIRDGRRVDPYVDVQIVTIEGKSVAVLRVVARHELTFVRSIDGKRWEYYLRNGNKTIRIDIEDFEEHLLRKRSYR
ncbi:ATP-binding protein [Luteimonas sp. Sa2BVA3]|uniref:ATP-binding protein n=1 Tax=Luteimonas colneyensis TaxID=2762230 RepID=A0ABR8UGG5_9GAMM|nr:ATP-binding protein [Luteimonas colneyensis]MBD7986925.1 ATP-binding protein [Luteimonas colneyensis]